MDIIKKIIESSSLASLKRNNFLPEPYSDSGYFYIYYASEDYKLALVDIVSLLDKEVRVFYDRHNENGKAREQDLLARAKSFSCRAIIFYLSKNVLKDELFWSLLTLVKESNIKYGSVNLIDENGFIYTSNTIVDSSISNERQILFKSLFSEEVTYLSINDSLSNKIKGLKSIGANDPLIYNAYSDTSAKIIGVKSLTETSIIVPEKVLIGSKEYVVDLIEPRAFKGCIRLKSIVLPNTIKHMGIKAYQVSDAGFDDDIDLANYSPLLDSSFNGDGFVFEGCISLKGIVLPVSLEELFLNNFVGCKNLRKIVVNNGIKKVIGNRFESSTYFQEIGDNDDINLKLDELVLPSSFKYRNEMYFFAGENGYQFIDLANIKVIKGIEPIEEVKEYISKGEKVGSRFAFSDVIESVDLSKMQEDIVNVDFQQCTKLKKVVLPQKAHTIISASFDYCSSLEELMIGNNVQKIEHLGLSSCDSLKKIVLPNSLIRFDMSVLMGLENLETLVIDSENAKNLMRSITNYGAVWLNPSNGLLKKITYPLIVWFSFLIMCFSRYFLIAIISFVFFPISVPLVLLKKQYDPTKGLKAKTILLKKNHYRAPKLSRYIHDKEKDTETYFFYTKK